MRSARLGVYSLFLSSVILYTRVGRAMPSTVTTLRPVSLPPQFSMVFTAETLSARQVSSTEESPFWAAISSIFVRIMVP